MPEFSVRITVTGIDAVITNHLEVLFRDMSDETLYEIQNRDGFINKFVIFVSVVVESHEITIVFINAGSGNYRASEISANVFSNGCRIGEARFGINIEAVPNSKNYIEAGEHRSLRTNVHQRRIYQRQVVLHKHEH